MCSKNTTTSFANKKVQTNINNAQEADMELKRHLQLAIFSDPTIDVPKTAALGIVFLLMLHTTGFCDGASSISEIETLTNSTINTIFSPWIRKAALAFGGGFGLFQSYTAGSFKPLLTWGGLGLIVNYIPKLIDIISKVGA